MNLDTLSVMKAEKLTRFLRRVKNKDAIKPILFARISEIRDTSLYRLAAGSPICLPLCQPVHPRRCASTKKRDAIRVASFQINGPGRARTSDLTLIRGAL